MSTRLSVKTAADLLDALRVPSEKVRLAVLQAIQAQPAHALALGRQHGWDVVDELVHHAYQPCSMPYFRAVVRTLSSWRDPRVADLFTKLAAMSRDADTLSVVRAWLDGEETLSDTARIALSGPDHFDPVTT